MRRVVVVNDCAHVIEDMLPFLRRRFDVELIERTRGLYSKTVKCAAHDGRAAQIRGLGR